MFPCDFNDATKWIEEHEQFIILYTHKAAFPDGHYIALVKKDTHWVIIDSKVGKGFIVNKEHALMVILGADGVISVPTYKENKRKRTSSENTTELESILNFLKRTSIKRSRKGVAWIRDCVNNKEPVGNKDSLALLYATGGQVLARKLLDSRATVLKYVEILKGFRRKDISSFLTETKCTETDISYKLKHFNPHAGSEMTRADWVKLFPCIWEIALTDPENQGRPWPQDVTLELISQRPWLASNNIHGKDPISVLPFLQHISVSNSRDGVKRIRRRIDKSSPLDRMDALAVLHATGGQAPARKLLNSRKEVFEYLKAFHGFCLKTGTRDTIGPSRTDIGLQSGWYENIPQDGTLLTRSQWVGLFPCIMEIAITDPEHEGVQRPTAVTCEMILNNPQLAQGNAKIKPARSSNF